LGGAVSVLMSVYLPTVVSDLLGKSNSEMLNEVSAYINSMFLIGWTIGGVTWGVIGDRIGRAKATALAFAMFGLFTLLIGFAPSWAMSWCAGFSLGLVLVEFLVVTVTLLLGSMATQKSCDHYRHHQCSFSDRDFFSCVNPSNYFYMS